MKYKIIQIGDSKYLRLPTSIIEQCKLSGHVELIVSGTNLVVKAIEEIPKPRKGWTRSFKLMHERSEDKLLIPESLSDDANFEW